MDAEQKRPPAGVHDCRKEYHPPELLVYGNIRELTQVVGFNSAKNDGGEGNTKTA
jgi:hypothetical protein